MPELPARLTRRDFVVTAGAALATLAAPKTSWGRVAAAPTTAVRRFRSAPHLTPPKIAVVVRDTDAARGSVFVAPINGPGQHGPLIVDDRGEPVWFHPLAAGAALGFRVQRYRTKSVLTWWEGEVIQPGYGNGEGVIANDAYEVVARVRAGNGYSADLHEFQLTARGTALITIYDAITADLSSVGGPKAGPLLESIIQEVDVRTGRVLLEWHALDHVPLSESYLGPAATGAFDYFHVNSIDVMPDGNLLISARNTSALYKLDRKTGAILWRLGGKRSDFELAPEARFMWQHDARAHANGTITLFDDGPRSQADQQSRGLRLRVDESARRVELDAAYTHDAPVAAIAMGNAQQLSDGGMFVGWGTVPRFTEFAPDGTTRFDATFPGANWNYRAYRSPWVGRPRTRPALAATRAHGRTTLYASWNGSTETAFWQVHGGDDRHSLERLRTVRRNGFETAIPLQSRPRVVAVTALDRRHRPLGTSAVVAAR